MICIACHIAILHPNNKHSSHTLVTLIIHVITCIPHLITSTSFRITGNENKLVFTFKQLADVCPS